MSGSVSPLKRSTRAMGSGSRDARDVPPGTPTRSNSRGRMRAIFCDVVIEGLRSTQEGWQMPPGTLGPDNKVKVDGSAG